MRVLMLSWEYPPYVVGGLGQHVADLVPALAALGVEVHLVTPDWRKGEFTVEPAGVHVHRVPVQPGDGDIMAQATAVNRSLDTAAQQIVVAQGPMDVIHAHDWLVSFAAASLKQRFKVPLIATIHATEYGRSQGRLDSLLSRAINAAEWQLAYEAWQVIVCSNFMATEVIESLAVPPDKIGVVPNGVQVARFDPYKQRDLSAVRARFAAVEERIVFNVGRMVREKGLHVLVEAMPKVLAEAPQAKLVVAGKPDPWGYWAWNKQRAEELGIASRCYFTGFLPDADRDALLTLADVAVFPSLYEPFGMVAPEAMAAGAPVVVSSAGGLSEIVTHMLTGLTTYPNDPGSLAWAIIETLKKPEEARARARSALRRVMREYNWASIAAATLDVYWWVARARAASSW